MTDPQPYRRLPGRSGLIVRYSLWIKPDHLLRVRSNPFSQEYRRYYFKDIQALVLTEVSNPVGYLFYGLAAFFAIAALVLYVRHPVWATLCGLPAIFFWFLGWRTPDCACSIRTRVSADRLPSLGKLRSARQTIALLKAQINQVQGELSAEALQSHSPSSQPAAAPSASIAAQNLRHCSGQAHWILFALLLLHAAFAALLWLRETDSRPLSLASNLLESGAFLAAILAAILQRRSDMARAIRYLVYGAIVWPVLSGVTASSVAMFVVLRTGPTSVNPAALMRHPAIRMNLLAGLIIDLALALAGIILLWRHQRSVAIPPPLSPEPITTTPDGL